MGYEVDFLPVGDGNGDAICLRYGSENTGFTIHVVDGGYTETGKTIIDHIDRYYGAPNFIDHVVLSHADQDHASGLLAVMEHFDVGALWMNRPWLYSAEIIHNFHSNFSVDGLTRTIRDSYPILVQLEEIAGRKGVPIFETFAGTQIGNFKVLAPLRERYLSLIPELDRTPTSYAEVASPQSVFRTILTEAARAVQRWFETWGDEKLDDNPPPTSASNETSIVQLGHIDGRRLLLTADVGPAGLAEAADVAEHFGTFGRPKLIQIPHHGSRRNVTPTVLNRWLGHPIPEGTPPDVTAFCSVGKEQAAYPRHRVRNAFLRRGCQVISTRDTWKSHYYGMDPKPDCVPVESEPFSYEYEE